MTKRDDEKTTRRVRLSLWMNLTISRFRSIRSENLRVKSRWWWSLEGCDAQMKWMSNVRDYTRSTLVRRNNFWDEDDNEKFMKMEDRTSFDSLCISLNYQDDANVDDRYDRVSGYVLNYGEISYVKKFSEDVLRKNTLRNWSRRTLKDGLGLRAALDSTVKKGQVMSRRWMSLKKSHRHKKQQPLQGQRSDSFQTQPETCGDAATSCRGYEIRMMTLTKTLSGLTLVSIKKKNTGHDMCCGFCRWTMFLRRM